MKQKFDTLTYSKDGAVAEVLIHNLATMNAFNNQMHDDWRSVLDSIETDETVRVLIVTGEGKAFCSGQDLSESLPEQSGTPQVSQALDENYNPFIKRFMGLPIPTINAINGPAAGAGANFALAADLVIAAESAFFEESFVKIGLIPDVGGTWVLPRLIGRARALGMMLSSERVDAKKAESWGMIWKAVPDDHLMATARKFAQLLSMGPRDSFKLIKKATMLSENNTLEEQLDLERDLQAAAAAHPDFKEGVTAFKEKRMPKFAK